MSWGAGGKHLDEMLVVRDHERAADMRRAAAVTVVHHLGPDSRDVLEALGLVGYWGHDMAPYGNVRERPAWRDGSLGEGA